MFEYSKDMANVYIGWQELMLLEKEENEPLLALWRYGVRPLDRGSCCTAATAVDGQFHPANMSRRLTNTEKLCIMENFYKRGESVRAVEKAWKTQFIHGCQTKKPFVQWCKNSKLTTLYSTEIQEGIKNLCVPLKTVAVSPKNTSATLKSHSESWALG